jgi:hypothetical protein
MAGVKLICFIARRTASTVAAATRGSSLTTRETVDVDTPAILATVCIDTC